ncbi:hypothetical protein Tsubulata_014104 [Turnera subulata]|uniref:Cation/H+ exchanger domain-containing protein n=1 Tax=Turnera subulata TaxID=218843 RepID=A0A9Q0GB50_9ROSI|nr:hypothetical protein Tsubulata_014104 [Turnera subulata]
MTTAECCFAWLYSIWKFDLVLNLFIPLLLTNAVETFASTALLFYMFLVGLEMDLAALQRIETKVIVNVTAGLVASLVASFFTFTGITKEIVGFEEPKFSMGPIFTGAVISVTSFPDLARTLADLKILNTNVGRWALSSAFLNDLVSWTFVIGASLFSHFEGFLSAVATLILVLTCWFVVRPILIWKISNFDSNRADVCGTHSMVGGFLLGLIMPKGELATRIGDQLEELTTGVLLPFFFITIGFKTNIGILPLKLRESVTTFGVAWFVKIVTSFVVAMLYGMSLLEGVTFGVLMNTKGILSIIILNLGQEIGALHVQLIPVMFVMIVAMTVLVKPITFLIYNPKYNLKSYTRRTIESVTEGSDFRILLCIHGVHHIAGLTNLVQYSHSTKQSPILVFAAHLVQLVGRATAMLIVHGGQRSNNEDSKSNHNQDNADQIIDALGEFEKKNKVQSVQALTVVSPYDTMDEDIYNLAEDKFINLILVPFNKPEADDIMSDEACLIRKVTQNLLKRPPCTVGLLLDRCIGLAKSTEKEGRQLRLNVAMLFCGGADSREALAYSSRLAESRNINLTVVKFLPGTEAKKTLEENFELQSEEHIDDQYITEFKLRTMQNPSIIYGERVVNTGVEIVEAMSELFNDFHVCILGKGEGMIEPFTMGLSEWTEYEELGVLGGCFICLQFC